MNNPAERPRVASNPPLWALGTGTLLGATAFGAGLGVSGVTLTPFGMLLAGRDGAQIYKAERNNRRMKRLVRGQILQAAYELKLISLEQKNELLSYEDYRLWRRKLCRVERIQRNW